MTLSPLISHLSCSLALAFHLNSQRHPTPSSQWHLATSNKYPNLKMESKLYRERVWIYVLDICARGCCYDHWIRRYRLIMTVGFINGGLYRLQLLGSQHSLSLVLQVRPSLGKIGKLSLQLLTVASPLGVLRARF